MKKVLTTIGMLYVLVGMFIFTDLNPLLYWNWYRNNIDVLLNIIPNLPTLWIISVLFIAFFIEILSEKAMRQSST